MLRNSGRRDEANTEWARVERVFGPLPRQVLVDHLYWDGPMEAAERAATEIITQVGDDPDPIAWGDGGRSLCILEIWRLRSGDVSHTGQTVARLRAGSDDADPTHGQNALCALVLEAMLESASGGVRVDELIADVQSARLADLAGDTDWALRMYRHFLVLFDGADASFDEELERIRNRVAELVAG